MGFLGWACVYKLIDRHGVARVNLHGDGWTCFFLFPVKIPRHCLLFDVDSDGFDRLELSSWNRFDLHH